MSDLFFIDNSEKINLLGHIKETISLIDYPSPMIFSVLSRLSIVSFLRGKGVLDDIIDRQAIDIFKQLSNFAAQHNEYSWFDDWSKRLIVAVKERKIGVSR